VDTCAPINGADTSGFGDTHHRRAPASPDDRYLRSESECISTVDRGIRRLFPTTPTDAVTAFCVSEARGPHPRYINTAISGTEGQWKITGEKMWGTMAPAANMIYVAVKTGESDGQNQLSMVSVDPRQSSVTQLPLPPERNAGPVPICDLQFEQTDVTSLFDGDAYTQYIKPFRLIEDVYSTVAMQIALLSLGKAAGLSHAQREDLVALVAQGFVISASAMDNTGDVLLLTSYLRASQNHWKQMAGNWDNASETVRQHWNPKRDILTVASRAREKRRQNAWQSLGDALPDEAT
ncbi:MAG: acyl-CoA dehydrogenase family protein, partial [Pseudomonadota bacterium]